MNKRLTAYEYTCSVFGQDGNIATYVIKSWEYLKRQDIRKQLDIMGLDLITYTTSQTIKTYSADLEQFLTVAKPI